MSHELSQETHEEISKFCTQGDRFAENRQYESAIGEYNKAWKLLPEPKNNWNAATWILAAITEASFLSGYYTSAREAVEYVMTCPGAVGNAFLHLRYGQILFELGEEDAATDELMRAYMAGGREIFSSEEPKYIELLKSKADI